MIQRKILRKRLKRKQNPTPPVLEQRKVLEAEEESLPGADQEIEDAEEAEAVAVVNLVAGVAEVAELTEKGETLIVISAKKIIKLAIARSGRTPTPANMSSIFWPHQRTFVPIA